MTKREQSHPHFTIFSQLKPRSKILFIVTDNQQLPQPPKEKHLIIHQCTIDTLKKSTEHEFKQQCADKDYIIFTEVTKGNQLILESTQKSLIQCLGNTATKILNNTVPQPDKKNPINLTNYIQQIEQVIGKGACLLKTAITQELYMTIRSNPGEQNTDEE